MLSKLGETEYGEPIFAGVYNEFEISVTIGEYAEINFDKTITDKNGKIKTTYPYGTIYVNVCNNAKLETLIKNLIDNVWV